MEAYKYKFEKSTMIDFARCNFKNLTSLFYYAELNPIEVISSQMKDFCCRNLKKAKYSIKEKLRPKT